MEPASLLIQPMRCAWAVVGNSVVTIPTQPKAVVRRLLNASPERVVKLRPEAQAKLAAATGPCSHRFTNGRRFVSFTGPLGLSSLA